MTDDETIPRPPDHAPHLPPDVDAKVRQVELLISTLLRTGVVISLTLVVIGALLGALRHPDLMASSDALHRLTTPGADFPHTWRAVGAGLLHLQGQAIIATGLLLLIATPVMRVAVSVFAFRAEGDKLYTRITLAVLFFLLLSFVLGRVE